MSDSTKQDLPAFLRRTRSLMGNVWASSARLQIPSSTAPSAKLIPGRSTPEKRIARCREKRVLQVSHVFMTLVEVGLAVLTDKAGAGTVARDVAFSHIVPTANDRAGPGLAKQPWARELAGQAPEQIMINTPLWVNLTTLG